MDKETVSITLTRWSFFIVYLSIALIAHFTGHPTIAIVGFVLAGGQFLYTVIAR